MGSLHLLSINESRPYVSCLMGIRSQDGTTRDGDGMRDAQSHLSPCVGVWAALLKIGWLY